MSIAKQSYYEDRPTHILGSKGTRSCHAAQRAKPSLHGFQPFPQSGVLQMQSFRGEKAVLEKVRVTCKLLLCDMRTLSAFQSITYTAQNTHNVRATLTSGNTVQPVPQH